MNVTVYGDVRRTPETYKLWTGNLSALPRPDDFISLHGDYVAFIVRSVTIIAPTDEAAIKVWMNAADDYPHID